jgi:hypothetical protein
MSTSSTQSADIRGDGNIIVQFSGDNSSVSIESGAPFLQLTSYTNPFYSDVQRADPTLGLDRSYTTSGLHQLDLLKPYTRSLCLVDRESQLEHLQNWLATAQAISIKVLTGAGGRGKTRLALELCLAASRSGWHAGFVTREALERFVKQPRLVEWGSQRPTLVVVDYAAAKADLLQLWLKELTFSRIWLAGTERRLRLLLLERHGQLDRGWLKQVFRLGGPTSRAAKSMLDDQPLIELRPLGSVADRYAVFREAHLLATTVEPEPSTCIDALLAKEQMGEPLFAAMLGLRVASDGVSGQLLPSDLAFDLASDELERISRLWHSRGLPTGVELSLEHHLAAAVTLCGGWLHKDADRIIEAQCRTLGFDIGANSESLRAALYAAMPGDEESISPIMPDLVGEAAVLLAWGSICAKTKDAIKLLAYVPDFRAGLLSTLSRVSHDYPERGAHLILLLMEALRAVYYDSLDPLKEIYEAVPYWLSPGLATLRLNLSEQVRRLHLDRIRRENSPTISALEAEKLANHHRDLAQDYDRVDNFQDALEAELQSYQLLVCIFEKIGDSEENYINIDILALVGSGRIFHTKPDNSEGHNAVLPSFFVSYKHGLAFKILKASLAIAARYEKLGDVRRAIEYSERACAVSRMINAIQPHLFLPLHGNALIYSAVLQRTVGNLAGAALVIQEALQAYEAAIEAYDVDQDTVQEHAHAAELAAQISASLRLIGAAAKGKS